MKLTREVKKFGLNGAHVTVPKLLVGKSVVVLTDQKITESNVTVSSKKKAEVWWSTLSNEERVKMMQAYLMINGGE